MKIGIDVRLWNETGVGRYIRNLVTNLRIVDKKNEYVLFVRSRDVENISKLIANSKLRFNRSKWRIVKADIKWHGIGEQLKFPQILYKENLDLMHFPYFSLPILYNKPFVTTIHDLIIHHFPTGKASTLPMPIYKLKRLGYNLVLRRGISKARKIIVPLNSVKNDLIQSLNVPPDKVAVTYEGVDDEIRNPNIEIRNKSKILNTNFQNNNYFLYVGNAYPHKNLETLIKAFLAYKRHPEPFDRTQGKYRMVHPKGSHEALYNAAGDSSPDNNRDQNDVQLLLVGKQDYFYRHLKRRLQQEDITDIHILNDINDNALQLLYKHALAVVAPSFMEGFGLVPLEAIANSCLVIASDIPAHREVCGDAVIYFNPYDVGSLQKCLYDICYYDSNHSNKYISEGEKRLKLFSWKKMAEETLGIYEQFKK